MPDLLFLLLVLKASVGGTFFLYLFTVFILQELIFTYTYIHICSTEFDRMWMEVQIWLFNWQLNDNVHSQINHEIDGFWNPPISTTILTPESPPNICGYSWLSGYWLHFPPRETWMETAKRTVQKSHDLPRPTNTHPSDNVTIPLQNSNCKKYT